MNDFFINSIPKLTDDQLMALVKDCESRIGSHVAGGDPNEQYVEHQKMIIGLVQEEFSNRGTPHAKRDL